MEVAGLAIGLVGLYNVCVEVLEKVDAYRNFGAESRLALTRLDINKAIFKDWADRVGLTAAVAGTANVSPDTARHATPRPHHPLLEDPAVGPLVQRTLACIRDIFSATDISLSKLDLLLDMDSEVSLSPGADATVVQKALLRGLKPLEAAKKRPLMLAAKKAKLGWAWGGKGRFIAQVEAFEVLLERLRTLVPPGGVGGSDVSSVADAGRNRDGKSGTSPIVLISSHNLLFGSYLAHANIGA
jgi:hypothetical protein